MNQEWEVIIEEKLKSYNAVDSSKSVIQTMKEFNCENYEIPYFVCKKKSLFTLFKENVYTIVTQKAIYYKIKKSSFKIPFEKLAEIVFYGGSTFCYAYVDAKQNEVLDEGFWADLFVSEDRLSLITVLHGIQEKLLQESDTYRNKRKEYFEVYLDDVEKNFNENYKMDVNATTIMDELMKEDEFKEQIFRIKIAIKLTDLNNKKLNDAINDYISVCPTKQDLIIKYTAEHLDNLYKYVRKEFEEKLKLDPIDFRFCNSDDIDVSKTIEIDENLTVKCKEIYPHIYFWHKIATFEDAKSVEDYCRKYGINGKEEYLIDWAKYVNKNREMLIFLGNYFRDGFGLTNYHYLLLKKGNDGSEIKLDKIDNKLLQGYVAQTLDLGLLAVYKNKPQVLEKLFEQSPEYQAILEAKNSAEKALKWANLADFGASVLNLTASAAVKTLQKAEGEFNESLDRVERQKNEIDKYDYAKKVRAEDVIKEKTEEFQSQYERMENGINASHAVSDTLTSLSDDLKKELDFINEEIEGLKKSFFEDYRYKMTILNANATPFSRMIFDIYDGLDLSDFIYTEYVVTTIEGMTFVIPRELYKKYFENYHQDASEEKKSEETKSEYKKEKHSSENVKKPYIDSWFSNAAHNDLSIMRKEYRELVKKYHPDNFDGSSKYFIQIQEERAQILAEHKFK